MRIQHNPTDHMLSLTPKLETTLEADGFLGSLYRPRSDCCPGKALIVMTGADGSYSLTRLVAEQFVRRGITALALAYWNQKGLSASCRQVPLETVQRAVNWLRRRGLEPGLWGISLGAVYALLCGCYLPQKVGPIVAVSPMSVCPPAIEGSGRRLTLSSGSAFCFQGREIPCSPDLSPRNVPEAAQLPVERLQSPLLLLASDRDEVWDAGEAADAMVRRLEAHAFPYPVFCRHYDTASHYLLPVQINARLVFQIEREQPEACARSNRDAFEDTLQFLRAQW